MKPVFVLSVCLLLFTSCGGKRHKFWDISKFNIVDTALKDKEEIKLLYTSRGPGNNEDLEYYIQVVAVSQRTGDTVNILTTVYNGFTMDDEDKVFNYFNQNNFISKLSLIGPEKLNDVEELNKAREHVSKEIKKVARDPEFDMIADNTYPTVIGTIGTTSK